MDITSQRHAPGLPIEEFTHPVSIASMVLMAVNDHLLKGSGLLPGWLTGKVSDFAGLLFFPLLLTALLDTALYAANRALSLLGRQPAFDDSLRPWKLFLSCALTSLVFASIQLSETAAATYESVVRGLGFTPSITMDMTDLAALVSVPLAYLVGRSVMTRARRK